MTTEQKKNEKVRYECVGSVRGWCGHYHRTITGAFRCLERDRAGCRGQGGYSDRWIYRTGNNALSVADREELERLEAGGR